MLQIGNKPIDTMYVGGKLVQQVYLGGKKIYPEHGVIPKGIKDAMVLWYDIKRQGATNESMAENPVLRDLSGNGHDATCYNFAWSGMSGIGGYLFDSLTNWYITPHNNGEFTVDNTKLHISKTVENYIYYYINNNKYVNTNTYVDSYTNNSITFKPFKIKVSGLPEGYYIVIDGLYNDTEQIQNQMIPKITVSNGEHIINEGTVSNLENVIPNGNLHFPRILTNNMPQVDCDITVEFLPEYPNALVSDGVDDFAQVLELPLLTREQGYTIIAKRTYLNDAKGCLASYRGTNATDGPFAMELVELNRTDSFGGKNTLTSIPELITWQRKDSYNGISIYYADSVFDAASRYLNIFKLNPAPTEFNYVGQIALYSLILFDRDLTDEEIEWVKTNLIETEE